MDEWGQFPDAALGSSAGSDPWSQFPDADLTKPIAPIVPSMPAPSPAPVAAIEPPPGDPRLLAALGQIEQQRADPALARSLRGMERFDYLQGLVPFLGDTIETAKNTQAIGALGRIKEGAASEEDYGIAANFIDQQRRSAASQQQQGILGAGLDIAAHVPKYVGEYALTGGGFGVGKAIGGQAAKGLIGGAAKSAAGRLAVGGAEVVGGLAGHTTLNPAAVTASASRRAVPGVDEQGNIDDTDGFIAALPAGYLDTMIELGSERAGGLVTKIPGVRQVGEALKRTVIGKWLSLAPGRTPQMLDDLVKAGGWNGILGEVFEERVGDVARLATGLEGLGDNVTGQLATGEFGKAGKQLAAEFFGIGLAAGAGAGIRKAASAADRLQTQTGAPEAPPQIVEPEAPPQDPQRAAAEYRKRLLSEGRQPAAAQQLIDPRLLVQPDDTGIELDQPAAQQPQPGKEVIRGQMQEEEGQGGQGVLGPQPPMPTLNVPAPAAGDTVSLPAPGQDLPPAAEPTTFRQKLFQGRGKSRVEIYGQEAVDQGRAVPVFGPGQYYAFSAEDAANFGDVTEHEAALNKPFVLDSDRKWFDLLKAAGTPHLNNMGREFYENPKGIEPDTRKLQAHLKAQGYDGMIVRLDPSSDNTRRLNAVAGNDQVVVFGDEAKPPVKKLLTGKPAQSPTTSEVVPPTKSVVEAQPSQPASTDLDALANQIWDEETAPPSESKKIAPKKPQATTSGQFVMPFPGMREDANRGEFVSKYRRRILDEIEHHEGPEVAAESLKSIGSGFAAVYDAPAEKLDDFIDEMWDADWMRTLPEAVEPGGAVYYDLLLKEFRGAISERRAALESTKQAAEKKTLLPKKTPIQSKAEKSRTAAADSRKAFYDAVRNAVRNPKMTVGGDADLMRLAVKAAIDTVNEGVWNFAEYVETVYNEVPDLIDTLGPYLEAAWRVAKQRDTTGKISESGSVADVLASKRKPEPQQDQDLPPSTGDDSQPADIKLASRVAEQLLGQVGNRDIDAARLFSMADEAYGGTRAEGAYGPSDAYDALETGVNQYLAEKTNPTVDRAWAKKTVRTLDSLIDRLPSQTNRSGEKDAYQQFSTPPAYAYAAAWLANIQQGDVVLEPSAGVGGIAIHAKNAGGVQVYGNELSKRRAALLETLGLDGVTNEDAEQVANVLPGQMPQPTVVLMNPPFSRAAERMGDKKVIGTDLKHVSAALEFLAPGGRLVAIVGAPLHAEKGETQTFARWLSGTQQEYNVRANVTLPRGVYKGYGTTFPTRVLVIDKTGPSDAGGVQAQGTVASLEELIDTLEQVRNERQPISTQPAGPRGTPKTGPGGKSDAPVQPPAGDLGTGESSDAGSKPGIPAGTSAAGGGNAGVGGGRRPTTSSSSGGQGGRSGGRSGGSRRPAGTSQPSGDNAGGESTGGVSSTGAAPADRVEIENRPQGEQPPSSELTDNIFEPYRPSKLYIPGSQPHPGSIVESAAMASVEAPDVTYRPSLPRDVIDKGLLSDIQLEAVTYAGQSHETMLPAGADNVSFRQGFMIGDGTGVGKGREIAGIILDNFAQGRKRAVWVTKNAGLLSSAKRDWKGLGQSESDIVEHSKAADSGQKISLKQGIMFTTYGTMRQNASTEAKKEGHTLSRVDQLVDWLGEDFDGVIAFDEAHEMAGAIAAAGARGVKDASQQGLAGLELQQKLPNARVVYVSATSATEVANLGYADRLGLWGKGTQFTDVMDFIAKIADGGVAAMELVARDMKALGRYLARSLSFNDGTPEGTVEYTRVEHKLTPEQRVVYDKLAEAWQVTLRAFAQALQTTGGAKNGRAAGAAASAYWSSHQRFFNQVITSMQLPSVLESMDKDIAAGRSVVIQLTNTGEANQERALAKRQEGDDLSDFDSSPADVLIQMVERSFPTQQYEPFIDPLTGREGVRPVVDSKANPVHNAKAVAAKKKLIEELESIQVPNGPIDQIIDHFGHENVAEVTGRSQRVILMENEKGQRVKTINKRTKDFSSKADISKFQHGDKHVLIFSEAGGTGASYHADRATDNQEKRMHYLLQAGWKAAAAIQGLGRTHRTNQAQAPEYILVHTDLKGQKRFLSTIARRLSQLGALTKGQRQTGSSGMFTSRDNLEGSEANAAMRNFFKDLYAGRVETIGITDFEQQTGLKLRDRDGQLLDQLPPVRQFLNRVLSLKVDLQNNVFDEFDKRLQAKVTQAEADGTLDSGIENLKADKVEKLDEKVAYIEPKTKAKTRYVKLRVSDKTEPISWAEIQQHQSVAFVRAKNGKIFSVEKSEAKRTDEKTGAVHQLYRLRPPGGHPTYAEEERVDRGDGFEKLDTAEARRAWEDAIASLPEFQSSEVHMITGVILPVWNRIKGNTQVRRTITDKGEQILGRLVPSTQIQRVLSNLGIKETGESALPDLSPQEAADAIEDGATLTLDNGWKIKLSRVQSEDRIEIVGPNFQHHDELDSDGVFREKVGFKLRYFIPTGDRAADVLDAITETRPIVKVEGGSGGTQTFVATPGSPSIPASMDASAGPTVSAQEVIATIAKLFGVPIRSGRVQSRDALGIYKKLPQIIRTKGQSSGDLAVISHELGHHLDKVLDVRTSPAVTSDMKRELRGLDYEPNKRRLFEGFAEFVRVYLTNDPDAARDLAPKFYDYLVNSWLPAHQKEADKIERVRSLITRWRGQGSAARVDSAISETGEAPGPVQTRPEWLRDMAKASWQQTLRTVWDETQVLKQADQALRDAGGLNAGDTPMADLYAVLSRASPGMAERAITDGVYTVGGERIGGSLFEAMKDITEAEALDFRRFLYARHALEVYDKRPGMNPGVAQEDAQYVADQVEADRAKFDRFTEAADKVTEYARSLLEVLTDAGVITPESAAAMRKAWETYVPLSRAMDPRKSLRKLGPQGGLIDIASPIARRRGSGRQVIDPIAMLHRQTQAFYNVAARKYVEREFVRHFDPALGGAQGMGGWLERVPANRIPTKVNLAEVWPAIVDKLEELGMAEDLGFDANMARDLGDVFARDYMNIWRPDYSPVPGQHVSRVIIDGKPVLYQWDPDLYDAVKGQAPIQLPWFARVLKMGVSALKMGATELNPLFAGANVARDWWTLQHQSQYQGAWESLLKPFGEIVTFAMSELAENGVWAGKPDAVVKLWKQMGGRLATRYGMDQQGVTNMRRQAMGLKRQRTLSENLILPVQTLREVINVSEVGPRLAEFVAALRESGYERRDGKIVEVATGQAVENVPLPVLVKAMRASQEVTVDFGRRGAHSKWVDQFVPFFGAALQGTYSLGQNLGRAGSGVRKLSRGESLERGEKRILIALASSAAATVAYWLMRGDDDDYKEEEDWLKYGHWTFTNDGKPILKVPKGYEYSFVPNFTEAVLNSIKQASLKPLRDAMYHEMRNRIPLNGPAVVTPALEAWANYDTFREKPIENQRMQRLKPGDRATPYNTALMKAIGNWLNVSPAKMEHVVDSVSGGGYRRIYGTAERLAEGRPEAADVPFVGAFVVRKDYAKSIDDFYNEKDRLEQEYNSAKAKGDVPNELADKFHRFEEYAELMQALRAPIGGERDRDKRFQYEKYIVGLSRAALGQEELERYPNPLKGDVSGMPKEIAEARREYVGRLANRSKLSPPSRRIGEPIAKYQERRANYEALKRRSKSPSN